MKAKNAVPISAGGLSVKKHEVLPALQPKSDVIRSS
jgi:hypothetical protein